ncbi:hypothetical protein P4O66_020181, partial [Electrophorus voltai]
MSLSTEHLVLLGTP